MGKRNWMNYTVLLVLAAFMISSCSSSKNSMEKNAENFDSFYDKFHKDVEFQMQRIVFPLAGKSVDANGEREWTNENWIPMKVKIYDVDTSKYKISYKETENTFVQKFWLPGTGFSAEYRFEKRAGMWFLVYASDTNL